jgi:hypothetical protein
MAVTPDELRAFGAAMREIGCLDLVVGDARIILTPKAPAKPVTP